MAGRRAGAGNDGSNRTDKRLTAEWEHFFHWLPPNDETKKIRREQIRAEGTSVERSLTSAFTSRRVLPFRGVGFGPQHRVVLDAVCDVFDYGKGFVFQ